MGHASHGVLNGASRFAPACNCFRRGGVWCWGLSPGTSVNV